MSNKKSSRVTQRAERIAKGKCGTCGQRRLAKDHAECRTCLDYYAELAVAARKKAQAKREKRNAQKRAWRARQTKTN